MKKFYNATYDLVFKKVFSDNEILAGFLNELLDEHIDPNEIEYVEGENISSTSLKTVNYDIRFQISNKLIFDMEMQRELPNYDFNSRIIYYFGNLISGSVEKGNIYEYSKRKKCIAIFLLDFNLFDKCINIAKVRLDNGTSLTDDEIIFVQLKKSNDCDNIKLRKWLELIKSDRLDDVEGVDSLMEKAKKTIKYINEDERQRILLEIDEKYRLDEYNKRVAGLEEAKRKAQEEGHAEGLVEGRAEGLVEGRAEGIKEGIKEGLEQGIEQGLVQGQRETKIIVAKNLKSMNIDVEVIKDATGLTLDEINKL